MTTVRTIPEAAAELRVSPRALTKIIVENGLYIAVSNRKRILDKQFDQLVRIMRARGLTAYVPVPVYVRAGAQHRNKGLAMGRLQPSACSQTIAASLEGCGSTIELYPQIKRLARPRSLSFTGRLLSYRGDRRDCLVFSGAFRKRVNPQPCRTAQNDSQTCSAAWEIAGRCVPESSREHDMTHSIPLERG